MEFSGSTNAKYTELIKKFNPHGAEKIDNRYTHILKRMNAWIEERNFQNYIKVDRLLLQHAVLDYFSDISRLKNYHGIETTNSEKVIAYEAYWLWRRRPLQIVKNPYDSDEDVKDVLLFCNEYFILAEICLYLYNGFDDRIQNEALKDPASNSQSFCKLLLYHLKFRQCNAQAFELMLWSFLAAKEISEIKYSNVPSSKESKTAATTGASSSNGTNASNSQ